ncbi:MAG: GNAT family N-acetyltransferase, partial [Chloroflexi bacterium]|nr:GNAT family N-acetyltransferase [Chloroflexota bacterium]
LSVDGTLSDDHEVAWHLHPNHWGHGYATEAARGAIQRAFEGGLAEVLALVEAENEASQRVAERLGMEDVGTDGSRRPSRLSCSCVMRREPRCDLRLDNAVGPRYAAACASQELA